MSDNTPSTPPTPSIPPAPPASINPNEALDLLGDLEARLGALKSWQAENDKHAEVVNAQAKQIAEREQALADQQAALETQRNELSGEQQQLAEQRESLTSERGELDTLRQSLLDQQQHLDSDRRAHDDHVGQQNADLESRWAEFHENQQSLNQRFAECDERQAELDRKHDELAEQQQKFQEEKDGLQSQWDELNAAREELAQTQQQLEESRQSLDADRATLEGDRGELDHERAEFAEQRQQLKDRKKELTKAHMDLKLRQDALEAQQASLDRARSELTEQAGDLNNDTLMPGFIPDFDELNGQAEARAQVAKLQAQLEAKQAELDQQREELAQQQSGAGLSEELQELERSLNDREAELTQKETLFREKLEQGKAKVLSAREKVKADEQALAQLQAELDAQRAEITEQQAACAQREVELDARAAELDELKTNLDFNADSAETLVGMPSPTAPPNAPATPSAEDQAFAEKLAQDKLDLKAQRDELSARAAELDGLTRGLEERQAAAEARDAELDAWAQRLEDQSQQLETQAESAQSQSDTPGTPGTPGTPDGPDLAGRLAAIDQREADLDQRQAELDQREADLAEQEADLLSRIDSMGDASLSDDEKDQTIAELREELKAAKDKYDKRKAQMFKADQAIKKRRDKVRKYLAQLREQSAKIQAAESQVESSSAQYAGLDKERRNLIEVKKFLENSEKAMVQKWATRSTASLVALILIALLGAATFSYFVGKKLAVPVWQSSMAISIDAVALPGNTTTATAPPINATPAPQTAGLARNRNRAAEVSVEVVVETVDEAGVATVIEGVEPGGESASVETLVEAGPITPPAPSGGSAADTLAQIRELVTAGPVMASTLNNLDQRGIRLFTNPAQLRNHLNENLVIAGSPARVEFTYTSEQPEYVVGVLDALGKSIVARQMTADRSAGRDDNSVQILQPAERNSIAAQDDSLLYAGISLASLAGIAMVLGLMIRVALGRSKQIMEEADGVPALATLDKPGTWSPIGSEPGA